MSMLMVMERLVLGVQHVGHASDDLVQVALEGPRR